MTVLKIATQNPGGVHVHPLHLPAGAKCC